MAICKKFISLILILLLPYCCAEDFPDFKQANPQWANYIYSSHNDSSQTIKNTGCALAALANIIYYWFDKTITPIDLAELSMKKFYSCNYSGGTSSYFFHALAQEYPFSNFLSTSNIDYAIQCIEEGGLVIVSLNGGVWVPSFTQGHHTCCIYNYSEEDGFRMSDPAAPEGIMSQIYGHASYDKLKEYASWFYCYWN